MQLVWHSAPGVVTSGLLLRLLVALTPLGILAVSKRIIDAVVNGVRIHWRHSVQESLDLAGARISARRGRANAWTRHRLFRRPAGREFGRDVGVRLMTHAASMDLALFEDPKFHDKLERARMQTTDRTSLLNAMGSLFQRAISLIALAAGVIYYDPWLFVLLLICVLPAFAGESHFAFLGYSLAHKLTPIRRELDYLPLR